MMLLTIQIYIKKSINLHEKMHSLTINGSIACNTLKACYFLFEQRQSNVKNMLILQFEDFTLFLFQILIAIKWQKQTEGERRNKQQRKMIYFQQKIQLKMGKNLKCYASCLFPLKVKVSKKS